MESGSYVIVRCSAAATHAGELVSSEGTKVHLKNARRIWYWKGAATLSELALKGTSQPDQCKFPAAVPEVALLDACEIIKVSSEAKQSIESVPVWSEHAG